MYLLFTNESQESKSTTMQKKMPTKLLNVCKKTFYDKFKSPLPVPEVLGKLS